MKTTLAVFNICSILLALFGNVTNVLGKDQYADASQPISICDVVSNAAVYDKKEITIRGLYLIIFHGSILMGLQSCPKEEINLKSAPDSKDDKSAVAMLSHLRKQDRFKPVEVVFRGTFRVAREGQCFGQICASYEMEINEFLSARPYNPDSPDLNKK
jgi:hypothetical protein